MSGPIEPVNRSGRSTNAEFSLGGQRRRCDSRLLVVVPSVASMYRRPDDFLYIAICSRSRTFLALKAGTPSFKPYIWKEEVLSGFLDSKILGLNRGWLWAIDLRRSAEC